MGWGIYLLRVFSKVLSVPRVDDILKIFSRYFHDSRLWMQKTEMMQMTTFNHRENVVKISGKYRENIISCENIVITLRKSRLLTQMTEMMQAEYRENIVKMRKAEREIFVARAIPERLSPVCLG